MPSGAEQHITGVTDPIYFGDVYGGGYVGGVARRFALEDAKVPAWLKKVKECLSSYFSMMVAVFLLLLHLSLSVVFRVFVATGLFHGKQEECRLDYAGLRVGCRSAEQSWVETGFDVLTNDWYCDVLILWTAVALFNNKVVLRVLRCYGAVGAWVIVVGMAWAEVVSPSWMRTGFTTLSVVLAVAASPVEFLQGCVVLGFALVMRHVAKVPTVGWFLAANFVWIHSSVLQHTCVDEQARRVPVPKWLAEVIGEHVVSVDCMRKFAELERASPLSGAWKNVNGWALLGDRWMYLLLARSASVKGLSKGATAELNKLFSNLRLAAVLLKVCPEWKQSRTGSEWSNAPATFIEAALGLVFEDVRFDEAVQKKMFGRLMAVLSADWLNGVSNGLVVGSPVDVSAVRESSVVNGKDVDESSKEDKFTW